MVAEADTLFVGAPHTQRVLKRRLTALQELAQYDLPDAEGQDRLRHLIDRLQVAMLAVDETGHCIAASEGATLLTGYSRPELLTTSVLNDGVGQREGANELWRAVLANRPYEGTTTITTHAGDGLAVTPPPWPQSCPGFMSRRLPLRNSEATARRDGHFAVAPGCYRAGNRSEGP